MRGKEKQKGGLAPFLLTGLICFLGACATAEIPAETRAVERVLFVGNSFTYYNNSLHNHFRKMVRLAGLAPESSRARIMTISGGRLPEHAAGLRQRLAEEDWDIVVLQGHSRGPIGDETAAPFRAAAKEYAKLIREDGAEPLFFMTWAYTDKPEMTAALDAAYTAIGTELNARVAPVGLAFAAVTTERPDIDLRTVDKRHPSLAGTYLAACTFFAVFHERTPEGLDYTAGLDPDDAAYLQQAAWQAAMEYRVREKQ